MNHLAHVGDGAEIDRLKAEVERLSELLWGSRCVYCGEIVGKDRKNQDVADDVLRKHVDVCPKHPLAQTKAELKAERERVAAKHGTICPFCLEGDFDREGLKHHYVSGHCKEYISTKLV